MKQVIVTFDYDQETDTVTNVKCSVDGIEKKKRTTKSKKSLESDEAEVIREDNKLVFSQKAVDLMGISPDDRIIIEYVKEKGSKQMFPVIGTDFAFDKEGNGNKVTKSFTVAFRGNANTILSEFGTKFILSEYKDELYKLVDPNITIENTTDEELNTLAESTEADLIVDSEETQEIDEVLNIGNFKFEL